MYHPLLEHGRRHPAEDPVFPDGTKYLAKGHFGILRMNGVEGGSIISNPYDGVQKDTIGD